MGNAVPETVQPVFFPYRPNGGFTPDDVGIRLPGRDTTVIDGATQESKDRLKKTFFDAGTEILGTLKDALKAKITPLDPSERLPRQVNPLPMPEVPTIRISGTAPEISTAGWWAIGILGTLLLIGIAKEGGIRP